MMTREEYGEAYKVHFRSTVLIMSAARNMSFDRAEEYVAAAWLQGLERLSQLKDSEAIIFWVNRIASRMFLSDVRSKKFNSTTQYIVELPFTPQSKDFSRSITARVETEKILKLCSEYEVSLLEMRGEGFTVEEIAEKTGVKLSTLKDHFHRLRTRIKDKLNRDELLRVSRSVGRNSSMLAQ